MWIDKKRFHDLIEEYQLLNEDLDDSWLDAKLIKLRGMTDNSFETYKNNRKSFADYKRAWYEEKKNRLANETSEERKERMERLDLVGNELFELFYTLIDSVLAGFGFQQLNGDDYCFDLKQETISRLLVVVNRFDTRKENPLAYFIQVIKNYMYNNRAEEFAHRYKFLTTTFLENHDLKDEDNPTQTETSKKAKEREEQDFFADFIS